MSVFERHEVIRARIHRTYDMSGVATDASYRATMLMDHVTAYEPITLEEYRRREARS